MPQTNVVDSLTQSGLLIPLDTCDSSLVSGYKLHEGFQYAWEDVRDTAVPAVASAVAIYPTYSLILPGHSLGGAVATIAAAYFRAAGYPCDVYSYVNPQHRNEAFVNFMDAQEGSHYRVTHTNDPNPRHPGKLSSFRHTSPELWLSAGSATTVGAGGWKYLSEQRIRLAMIDLGLSSLTRVYTSTVIV